MRLRTLSFLCVLTLLAGVLAGCAGETPVDATTTTTAADSGSTTAAAPTAEAGEPAGETTAAFTVETTPEGNTVVKDDAGNVIADSDNGDTIATKEDGEIVIIDKGGESHVITTAPTTAATTAGGKVATTAGQQKSTGGTTTTKPASGKPDPLPTDIAPGSEAAGVRFSSLAKAPADRTVSVGSSTKQFGRFLLTTSDNPKLPFNVACHITENAITALVPAGVDLKAIKANFTYYGKSVTYNGAPLTSRTTAMDLTSDAVLTLSANDGSTRTVTVRVLRMNTGLPSMSITTSGYTAVVNTVDYKTAAFAIGGGDTAVCPYATSSLQSGSDCSIKGRGNTTWTYDKKGYTLRFDTKYELLGLSESKNYVLLAMYADRSLMRYHVMEYLSEEMGLPFTMNLRYVDLWLNGEYVGVYGLVEKIEVEKTRVNITDYSSANTAANKIGYLLEFDDHLYTNASAAQRAAWKPVGNGFYDEKINEVFFYANVLGEDWLMLRTTNAKNLTADHVNYIQAVVIKAMQALKSGNYAEITKYIDVESFVQWYVIEEYLNNTDADMTSSVYMYLDVGGKLKLGPLWDMDNCAGNHTATASATSHALYDSQKGWFHYLFQCAEARSMIKTQWVKLKGVTAKLPAEIDATAKMLKTAAEKNFARWPILGSKLSTQPAAVASANTYQKQVDYLKSYLADRQKALDSFFGSL